MQTSSETQSSSLQKQQPIVKDITVEPSAKTENTNTTKPENASTTQNETPNRIRRQLIRDDEIVQDPIVVQQPVPQPDIELPKVEPEVIGDYTTQTIRLTEENAIRKLYEATRLKQLHIPHHNTSTLLEEYTAASINVIAGVSYVASILTEGGKALNIHFETSEKLTAELKVNLSKYEAFLKSLSSTPLLKKLGAVAGLSIVTYFGWKMGLTRKIPHILGPLVDVIPTSIPAGDSSPVKDAVSRTLQSVNQNTTVLISLIFNYVLKGYIIA